MGSRASDGGEMTIVEDCVIWAEVDLDAIEHNVLEISRWIGPRSQIMAVVKANAYGHGAVPTVRAILAAGVGRLGVGRTAEGMELRRAGVDVPILLMCYTLPSEAVRIARWDLTPTVNTWAQAQALSGAAVALGREVTVHIKADTGMSRYGLLPDEVVPFAQALVRLPGLRLEGFYTHFSTAGGTEPSYTHRQYAEYMDLVAALRDVGITVPLRHVSNSAATLDFPRLSLDAVRCGLVLFGLSPLDRRQPPFELRPAMSLKSRVARIRTLPVGSSISYGRTYVLVEPTPVALVIAGYGDGYHRMLSNRGAVLIRGRRAPIAGRICMDQFVVNISSIPGAQQDDEVVLFGQQGDECISVDEVARWGRTINSEVTTSILPRVERVYLRGGDIVGRQSLLGLQEA
jgi:alanine racemase